MGGVFGQFSFGDDSRSRVTSSLAYGAYEYDASRTTFGGLQAVADGIRSDVFELAVAFDTVAFESEGFRIRPSAGVRYLGGTVDGFTEQGPGINLLVQEQDIESLFAEIGVNFELDLTEKFSVIGNVGYMKDFMDDDNAVAASFVASGPGGRPFSVDARGIDDEAFVLGFGGFYDVSDAARIGVNYRCEMRERTETLHMFGLGGGYSF
jgi:outer membrane autotransporter protein